MASLASLRESHEREVNRRDTSQESGAEGLYETKDAPRNDAPTLPWKGRRLYEVDFGFKVVTLYVRMAKGGGDLRHVKPR